jgi:hypothetical protein
MTTVSTIISVNVDPDAKLNFGTTKYAKDSYPNFFDGNVYYNRANRSTVKRISS